MTDLSSLGDGTSGVWTRGQALRLLGPRQIDEMVRAGIWQVLWRGVYADGGFAPSPEQRGIAAVLATGGADQPVPAKDGSGRDVLRAVASGRTAARVWGFALIDDDLATGAREHLLDDVTVGRRLPPQTCTGRTLRPTCAPVRRGDVMRLDSGLWLTTPARTLLDVARVLSHEALVCAVDGALHRDQVALSDITSHAGRRGQLGAPALRTALAVADGRAESPAETLARLLLQPLLPGLEPQVELFDHAARLVARFDLGDRAVRFAVEADGKRGHAGAQMVAKDRRRDRVAEALGWTTERVTWFELRHDQQAFVRRVVEQHGRAVADMTARPRRESA